MSGTQRIASVAPPEADYCVQTVTAWMREAAQQLFRRALELEAEFGVAGVLPAREQLPADQMMDACMDVIRAKAAWGSDWKKPKAEGEDV